VTAGDPLAGLPRPPGDPGVATSAAHGYSAAAEQLKSAATQVLGVVKSLAGQDWSGAGSSSAVNCTVVLAGAFSQAAEAGHVAGAGLRTFGSALSHAQAQWDQARRLADEAMREEAAYRSHAESQAQTLDKQAAATANIGAAHAAAGIRSDAASYTSPLRGRAIALATQARDQATTASTSAAAAVGGAAGMITTPPPAPTNAHGVASDGKEDPSLLEWFNTWLGGANTSAGLLTAPPAALAGARWWSAARAGKVLQGQLQTLFDESVGPLALIADRTGNWAPVVSKARSFSSAATLFQGASDAQQAERRLSFLRGGLPDSPIVEVGGRVLGGVGILGDIGTIWKPDGTTVGEQTTNRVMAGANGISTVIVLNAATDEIPVAGEVVMIGSGLYLGGDWLYNHWSPFHDAMDDTGHVIAGGAHAVSNFVTQDVPDTAKHVLHDVEPWHW
jgi:hypothetical protein